MAFKLSTGLRNALLGEQDTITAATISFDNGSTEIRDSGNALLTKGFRPGDVITVSGSVANDGLFRITSLVAGAMTVSPAPTNGAAGPSITVLGEGKSFKDIFRDYTLRLYSGSAPANANAAETGTLLVKLTKASAAFTAGDPAAGLDFGAISAGVLSKSADVISGLGLADGTAGYYRIYDNGEVTGIYASATNSKRAQGTVGTAGTDLIISSTSIVTGATTTADQHDITIPEV